MADVRLQALATQEMERIEQLLPKIRACLTDMQDASDLADESNGTSDYNMRLVALALIARHFLRECADELLAPLRGQIPGADR